jgi:hypothetical protein
MAGRPKTRAKKAAAKKAPAKKTAKKKTAEVIPSFVTSYTELGKILGVSRQAINRWTKIEGAPKPRSDGRHSVSEWRNFMKSNDLNGRSHDLETLKARKLLAECENREMANAIKRREFVSLEAVRLAWNSHVGEALAIARKRLVDEQPPIVAGMDDPLEIRQINNDLLIEISSILHSGGELTP